MFARVKYDESIKENLKWGGLGKCVVVTLSQHGGYIAINMYVWESRKEERRSN